MMEFLDTCLSFPVIIFSGLLIISILYWLVAATGLIDIDTLDIDMEPGSSYLALDGDLDAGQVAGGGGMGVGASLMFKLGLYGVPMTLIITLLSIFGWLITYYGVHWGLAVVLEPGPVRYLLGALLLGFACFASAIICSVLIRPFRPLFKKAEQTTAGSIRGRVVIIRSSQASGAYGEAVYEDGGASLLLDVRPADSDKIFKRGERAVILDYDPASRIYSIISEDEFNGR